ncbi:hypothetical protein CW732_07830 [Olleya sp. Bg11-27]|nr:hypothetical protein CW732_07830 [Olleya sp. Bg11-27]
MDLVAIILECFVDFYLFFLDYKFWKKKKAQRKYEKEQGLPKQLMVYPSSKIYLRVLFLLVVLTFPVCFLLFINKDQNVMNKQMTQIHELLKAEKKQFSTYPKQLNTIIRNNPLHRNLTLDAWGNAFSYSVTEDGLEYSLVSKGADGVLNTEDDVE